MPRPPNQVPCPSCIEHAITSSKQPGSTTLCAACIAMLSSSKHNKKRIEAIATANQRQSGERGPHLLQKIHQMAANVDIATKTTPSPREKSIADLEDYSRTMITAINTRDFTNPVFKLTTADFQAGVIDVFPPTHTPAAHLESFRKMAAENPEYHMQLEDISTDLDECGEWAKVYLTVRATGRPPGLTREALGVLTWRREAGADGGKEGWCLVSHESMRTFVV